MKSASELHLEIETDFPQISEKANREYLARWGDDRGEYYDYTWFECLANALNGEMRRRIDAKEYIELLKVIENGFIFGDEFLKKTIDVAFTENLFWQVVPDHAKPYWHVLPVKIKDLYLDFHRRNPL